MNIRKTILSLFTLGVVSVLALFSTQAFFNDTETSTGNLLQAGALDLKIDNTCYYNGASCENGFWGGEADNPDNPTNRCSCTWQSKDLVNTDLFFNLNDLKPGDWEEDTISVTVDNPSWLCVNAYLTKNDDNTCTEPELADDPTCTDPGAPGNTNLFDGELAQNLNFVFWKDDGDNVFEDNEAVLQQGQGPASTVLNSTWALADSQVNPTPIPGGVTTYIGKAFCFGTLTLTPVGAGLGQDPTVATGFTCDGSAINNAAQTDMANATLSFYAEQARHNDAFRCQRPVTPPTAPTATPTPGGA